MKNSFRKLVNKIILPYSQLTYSQSGEDLILSNLFYKLSISNPSYLDIGANHPSYISNTYYFYLRGSRGVCVEPNPYLFKKIKRVRKHDTVLNVGVGLSEKLEADFYLFPNSAHGLSTFSREEAEYWKNTGMKKVGKIEYEKVIKVQLIDINTLITKYCKNVPDFISIDVEGLDLAILQSFDFIAYSPKVFIVETLKYDENQNEFRNNEIIDFMIGNGYEEYADTHVNTIFLKS
ncbi:MAG TPA: FkbM family methyltransferase [Ginsengibacter sp.]